MQRHTRTRNGYNLYHIHQKHQDWTTADGGTSDGMCMTWQVSLLSSWINWWPLPSCGGTLSQIRKRYESFPQIWLSVRQATVELFKRLDKIQVSRCSGIQICRREVDSSMDWTILSNWPMTEFQHTKTWHVSIAVCHFHFALRIDNYSCYLSSNSKSCLASLIEF